MQDLFADRLINLAIHQGVVRMDFARIERLDPEKKEAVLQPSLRLVLPLEAFMHMTDQVEKVRADMQQRLATASTPGTAAAPMN